MKVVFRESLRKNQSAFVYIYMYIYIYSLAAACNTLQGS